MAVSREASSQPLYPPIIQHARGLESVEGLIDRYFLCHLSSDARLLTVVDDSAGHRIVSSRDAAGNFLINGGSI
jgi:hypothetical protein